MPPNIFGVDGSFWGTVTGEEKRCWRLENGRIARKDTLGTKWKWGPSPCGDVKDSEDSEEKTSLGKKETFYVVGYRTTMVNRSSDSFGNRNMPTHTILLRGEDGEFRSLVITTDYGDCGSGWCSATWCKMGEILPIERKSFGPIHYIPKRELKGQFVENHKDYFDTMFILNDGTPVVSISLVGCDDYYPKGFCDINNDLFKQTKRFEKTSFTSPIQDDFQDFQDLQRIISLPPAETMGHLAVRGVNMSKPTQMSKRIIYVFSGASDLGKSTFALTSSLKSYDTDIEEKIPDNVYTYDIIVVGNRFPNQKKVVDSVLKNSLDSGKSNFRVTHVTFS